MRIRLSLAAAALLLAAPQGARAWIDEGHVAIAALAERRLGPEARAMIREVLGEGHLWDRDVALWADDHRTRDTAPLHWVDIPFAAGRYHAARDCPDDRCAVGRLAWSVAALEAEADPARRLEALRWLVHLVGDLHQPLHAAEGWRHGNRGGLRLLAHVGRRSYQASLHVLWDAEVLWPVLAGRSPLELARALDEAIGPAPPAGWLDPPGPEAWAGESNRLARAIYQELGVTPGQTGRIEVPEALVLAQRARVEGQLGRAGVRLAAVLDRIARARAAARPASASAAR